jgi:hypothetical protein
MSGNGCLVSNGTATVLEDADKQIDGTGRDAFKAASERAIGLELRSSSRTETHRAIMGRNPQAIKTY